MSLSVELFSFRENYKSPDSFSEKYSFETADFVGSGSSASVYRCQSVQNPDDDLIVKIAAFNDENQEGLQQEYDLLQLIDHERVPKPIAIYFEDAKCYTVMRRVNGLSLDKLRKQKDIVISEVKYLLVQLLDTVNYIHSLGVCHRDLKPDNIIVDEYFTLFLIDFNVAVRFNDPLADEILGGTGLKQWSAPETRTQLRYSSKCDAWSIGCILFYLLSGKELDLEVTFQQNVDEIAIWMVENYFPHEANIL